MSVDSRLVRDERPVVVNRAPSTRPSGAARSPASRSGRSPVVMSGAAVILLAIAASSLHVLFQDGFWWVVVVLVVIVVLGAAAAVRSLTSNAALPTAAAIVALGGVLNLFFLGGASIAGVIPTLDTPSAIGELLTAANASIYRQSVPAVADPAILFVLAAGFGLLAVVLDLLAIGARRPAFAAFPVLAILAVPVSTDREIADPLVFALTAAAFLAFLLLGSARPQPRLAAGIGAVAIIGSLIVPGFLPAVEPDLSESGPSLNTGVNPVLDLGDDLRRANDRTVLEYTTESGDAHYLRLVTLENFTAEQWEPTITEVDEDDSVDEFDPAPGLSADVETEPESTTVDVGGLSSRWLPMTYPATSVSGLPDDWYFESEGFSVSRPGATARGLDYTIESLDVQPTPDQLLAAGTTVEDGFEDYLALPEGLPPIIQQTAESVVGVAGSNYERALALQEFFRSSEFTYSEDAPVDGDYDGTGMDIIATFLDARSGYCVHFASSMAVMSRTLGIPSRVVVGFLPGDSVSTGDGDVYRVSTHDLHAWPELYFEGVGWVQFEPTPGRGELGDYADVTVAGVPAPEAVETAAPSTAPSAAPSPSQSGAVPEDALDDPTAPTETASSGSTPIIALGILAVLALSLLPAALRALLRSRLGSRLRAGRANAVDAWEEILRTAVDLGVPVTRTDTPRETATRLTDGGEPLRRIVDVVEQHSFAGTTLTSTRSLARDVAAARVKLVRAASRRRRLVATLYPPSIWRRIAHPFAEPD